MPKVRLTLVALSIASLLGAGLQAAVAGSTCTINGTAGNDTLNGTAGNDVICGKGGHDRLNGRGGNDILRGGPGEDALSGKSGNDLLVGGIGRDHLYDHTGIDKLYGGDNSDKCIDAGDGAGGDVVSGGLGVDVYHADGGDSVSGVETSVMLCPPYFPPSG